MSDTYHILQVLSIDILQICTIVTMWHSCDKCDKLATLRNWLSHFKIVYICTVFIFYNALSLLLIFQMWQAFWRFDHSINTLVPLYHKNLIYAIVRTLHCHTIVTQLSQKKSWQNPFAPVNLTMLSLQVSQSFF